MEWKTVKLFVTKRDNKGVESSFAAQVTLLGKDIEDACTELSKDGFEIVSVLQFERETLAAIIVARKESGSK